MLSLFRFLHFFSAKKSGFGFVLELKFLCKVVFIFSMPLSLKIKQESCAYRNRSQSTARVMSFTYMRKMNGPRIDP